MAEPDEAFLRSLRDIGADVPNPESVRSTVQAGYRRGLRRRRVWAIGSAAAVVLAVAGGTTVLSGGPPQTSHQLTPPVISEVTYKPTVLSSTTDAGTTVAITPATLGNPASPTARNGRETTSATDVPGSGTSPFVAAPAPNLLSPVSLPPLWTSFDPDGATIRAGNGYLTATWTGTVKKGFGNPAAPTPSKDVDHALGYLITDTTPSLTVTVIGASQGPRAPTEQATSRQIVVNGHAAQYLTAPANSYEPTYHIPAATRIVWQLPDHRWIQVWADGDDLHSLTGLAVAVTNQPTRFTQLLSLGLTLTGITNPTVIFTPGQPPSVDMCAVPDSAGGLNRSNNPCVSAFANRQSFDQVLANLGATTPYAAQQVKAATIVISYGGRSITVNTLLKIGIYKSGQLTVGVWAPPTSKLSAQQLATLAASVQAPTDLSITTNTAPTSAQPAPTG